MLGPFSAAPTSPGRASSGDGTSLIVPYFRCCPLGKGCGSGGAVSETVECLFHCYACNFLPP